DFLQALHDLEAICARHHEIEQDQVVAMLAVKLTDLVGIHRGRDGHIAGAAQHPLEQQDIASLIIDDQDLAVKNVGGAHHANQSALFALIKVCVNSSATSIVSMNSLTLI